MAMCFAGVALYHGVSARQSVLCVDSLRDCKIWCLWHTLTCNVNADAHMRVCLHVFEAQTTPISMSANEYHRTCVR